MTLMEPVILSPTEEDEIELCEIEVKNCCEIASEKQPEKISSINKPTLYINSSDIYKVNECPIKTVDRSSSILLKALLQPPVICLKHNESRRNCEIFRHMGADHTYFLPNSQLKPKWLWHKPTPVVEEHTIGSGKKLPWISQQPRHLHANHQ